jgi:hypothetical protein
MNQALGEFLTVMGQVEFTMLMVVDLVSDAGIEALFDEYAAETFSGKIKWFRKWCAHRDEHFSAANKTRLRTIYSTRGVASQSYHTRTLVQRSRG